MKPSQPADRHDRDVVHLRRDLQGPPQDLLDAVEEVLGQALKFEPQMDDITVVTIRRL